MERCAVCHLTLQESEGERFVDNGEWICFRCQDPNVSEAEYEGGEELGDAMRAQLEEGAADLRDADRAEGGR